MSPLMKEFPSTDTGLTSLAVVTLSVAVIAYLVRLFMAKSQHE